MSRDPYDQLLNDLSSPKPTGDDYDKMFSEMTKPKQAAPSAGLQFDLTRDGRERFIPQNNTWNLKSGAPSIQSWYQTQYKKPLPVKNFGQSKFETSVGWNHEDAMDVGINPTTSEGQALISYLRENNIPYQAFSRPIYKNGRTVSTGPHIHIGLPSPSLSRVPLGSRRASQPQSAIPTTPVAQPSMPASVGAEPSLPPEMRADPNLTRPRLATRVQANPRGMLETGNIDLYRRPVVKNRDGSISTVRSMSVNIDGQEVLIPTVSDDGRVLSEDEAIEQYKQTGKFLGKFDSPENATTYAKALHNAQAKQYQPVAAPTVAPQASKQEVALKTNLRAAQRRQRAIRQQYEIGRRQATLRAIEAQGTRQGPITSIGQLKASEDQPVTSLGELQRREGRTGASRTVGIGEVRKADNEVIQAREAYNKFIQSQRGGAIRGQGQLKQIEEAGALAPLAEEFNRRPSISAVPSPGIASRIKEKVLEYAPGLANLNTQEGIRTTVAEEGLYRAINSATLGATNFKVDPSRFKNEEEAALAEQVGMGTEFVAALLPYMAAAKAVQVGLRIPQVARAVQTAQKAGALANLGVRAATGAATFGTVGATREAIKGVKGESEGIGQAAKNIGRDVAVGAAFGGAEPLTRPLRAATVAATTYGIDKLFGAKDSEAAQSAAFNALFAAMGGPGRVSTADLLGKTVKFVRGNRSSTVRVSPDGQRLLQGSVEEAQKPADVTLVEQADGSFAPSVEATSPARNRGLRLTGEVEKPAESQVLERRTIATPSRGQLQAAPETITRQRQTQLSGTVQPSGEVFEMGGQVLSPEQQRALYRLAQGELRNKLITRAQFDEKVKGLEVPGPLVERPINEGTRERMSGVKRFIHTDFGEVTEAPVQTGVPKGKIRVVDAEGVDHTIQVPSGRGRGNERAVPVKQEAPPEPSGQPRGLKYAEVGDAVVLTENPSGPLKTWGLRGGERAKVIGNTMVRGYPAKRLKLEDGREVEITASGGDEWLIADKPTDPKRMLLPQVVAVPRGMKAEEAVTELEGAGLKARKLSAREVAITHSPEGKLEGVDELARTTLQPSVSAPPQVEQTKQIAPKQVDTTTIIQRSGSAKNQSVSAAPTKQIWEMPQSEYVNANVANPKSRTQAVRALVARNKDWHRRSVEQALNDGKPVSPEVLADYPDLQKKQQPKQKEVTAEEFADKTALLPEVVAETVMQQRGLPPDPEFIRQAAERTIKHYNTNEVFRKGMNSRGRRETLYGFMNHWLDAWTKKGGTFERPVVEAEAPKPTKAVKGDTGEISRQFFLGEQPLYNDPLVKDSLGLPSSASMTEVKDALKKSFGLESSSDFSPVQLRTWARTLGQDVVERVEQAVGAMIAKKQRRSEALLAIANNPESKDLFNKVYEGVASNAEVKQFKGQAKELGLSTGDIESLISIGRRNRAEIGKGDREKLSGRGGKEAAKGGRGRDVAEEREGENYGISRAQAEQMFERGYNIYKDFLREEGIMNWRDWVKQDADWVGLHLDSEYELHNRYLKNLPEDVMASDVVRAYQEGKLADASAPKTTAAPLKVESVEAKPFGNMGEPKAVEKLEPAKLKELWDTAVQRPTRTNKAGVEAARYELFIQHNANGIAKDLGVQESTINARLRSWSAYPAAGKKTHEQLNAGLSTATQWHGIPNVAYISKARVKPSDVDAFVKSIEAPHKSWNTPDGEQLRRYIVRTFLGIDTRIDYSDLNFRVLSTLKPLGEYQSSKKLITIRANSEHTVAHEIGHYLDDKWGREAGSINHASMSDLNYEYMTESGKLSKVRAQWMKRFNDFVMDISERSDIGSSYYQSRNEVFARFVDKFLRWTEKQAGVRGWDDQRYINDRFHEGDFRRFVRLLQEKAYVDIADGNPLAKTEMPGRNITVTEDRGGRVPQEETPEFKRWFGNSKVVGRDGKPLIVHHGAPDVRFVNETGIFRSKNEQIFEREDPEKAFFFSSDKRVADTYADDRRAFDYQNADAGVVSAYLKIENPLVIDHRGKNWKGTRDAVARAKAGGHDGVIITNVVDDYNTTKQSRPTTVYAVFESNQIKSATGNTGRFDPNNPDIRGSVDPTMFAKLGVELANLPRAVMTSFDLSAPLRQGAIFTLTEPRLAIRALGDMLRGISSQRYENFKRKLDIHPLIELSEQAGLHLTSLAPDTLSAKEEAYMTRLTKLIPGIKQSEQAYVSYLDSIRMGAFEKYVKEMKAAGLMDAVEDAAKEGERLRDAATKERDKARKAGNLVKLADINQRLEKDLKSLKAALDKELEPVRTIARFINAATGRGDLGKALNNATPVLNAIFFSPRYLASRIQLLNPAEYVKMPEKGQRLDPRKYMPKPQRIMFRKMFEFAGLIGLTLLLAKLSGVAEVETDDYDNPDFMKLKLGNTRYDIGAGFQQVIRLALRLSRSFYNTMAGSSKIKNEKNRIVNKGEENKFGGYNSPTNEASEILARFFRSKENPTFSLFHDMATGKDFEGEPFTLKPRTSSRGFEPSDLPASIARGDFRGGAILSRVFPMMAQDAFEGWKDAGAIGVLKQSPSLFGVGVQTYQPRASKPTFDYGEPLRRTRPRRSEREY